MQRCDTLPVQISLVGSTQCFSDISLSKKLLSGLENTTANLQSSLVYNLSPAPTKLSLKSSRQQPYHLNFKKIWQFGRLPPIQFQFHSNFHQSGGSTLKYVTASHHIISPTPTLVEESRLVTSGTCACGGIRPNEDFKGGRK